MIPEYQNPSGWTLALERREPLIELCRRHGVLIVEDVAYREMAFDTDTVLPSLWSLGPDIVLQAGTFSKIFCPGVRLGWAVGPPEVVEQIAAAKQLTDQCAGGLGQRMVEEYGRAGHFGRRLPQARELYAAHWRALSAALRRELGDVCTWSEPTGGFFTWLTLPEGSTRSSCATPPSRRASPTSPARRSTPATTATASSASRSATSARASTTRRSAASRASSVERAA